MSGLMGMELDRKAEPMRLIALGVRRNTLFVSAELPFNLSPLALLKVVKFCRKVIGWMIQIKFAVAEILLAVKVTCAGNVPTTVGVPAINPLLALMNIPGGRFVAVQLKTLPAGPVPVICNEAALPAEDA